MTPPPFAWPGLRLAGAVPERFVLRVERGVWGKAHGARTDYRWLATTPGFGSFAERLEFELALGSEDEPHGGATFWRSLDRIACAVRIYPSRATDATGRGGFLEKQVLTWRREPELPAALAAFTLLPFVARLDDEVWWLRRQEVDWQRPDAVLGLDDTDCPPVEVTAAELAVAVSSGIAGLGKAVGRKELTAAYACLLGDPPRAAWLRQLERPLPPEALAALLLPLARERGEKLSLASWVPSSRAEAEELETRWNILGEPAAHRFAPRRDAGADDPAAALLASTLLENDPERLETMPVVAFEVRPPAPAKAPEPHRPSAPPADELWPGPFELPLEEPAISAPGVLRELWNFARSVGRRWLDPLQLQRYCRGETLRPFATASEEARLLRTWAQQVAAARPRRVDAEEWAVKGDLLRAAVIAFVPDPSTVEEVGWPRHRSVPPLLFALAFGSSLRADLERRLGAEWGEARDLSRMLCERPAVKRKMSVWLGLG